MNAVPFPRKASWLSWGPTASLGGAGSTLLCHWGVCPPRMASLGSTGRLRAGVTVRHGMQSCRCILSCQITQGGPETADHLVSGCYGNKLKRRKASCTHPIRRKRLADPQIPPNPSPKPPCCNAAHRPVGGQ